MTMQGKRFFLLLVLLCVIGSVFPALAWAGPFSHEQEIPSPNTNGAYFGAAVSLSENYAFIGLPGEAVESLAAAGAVYVYLRSGSSWSQVARLVADEPKEGARFGSSVAVHGDYAVVGAPNETYIRSGFGEDITLTNAGAAYVFKLTDGTWTQAQRLTGYGSHINSYFGCSVAADDGRVVVGSYGEDSKTGAAYVYYEDGGSWLSLGNALTASTGESDDHFGKSVGIDDDYVIVGAPRYEEGTGACNAGAAYIYHWNGSSWDESTLATGECGDSLGSGVAIDDEYAVVGAPGDDAEKGAAFVYLRSGSSWSQLQKLSANGGSAGDWFGTSTSLNGAMVLVGAIAEASDTGAAYAFDRTDSWSQEKMTPSDGASGDNFAQSVSIWGNYALVGAPYADSAQGAAYIYTPIPFASTGAATGIQATQATLNAEANANGDTGEIVFQYGTTTSYGNEVTADQSPISGGLDHAMSATVTGLVPDTEYHFRVRVSTPTFGTTYGEDKIFTTGSSSVGLPHIPLLLLN
jgi:hypothetical protein